jgi:hypothetical protein
MSASEFEAQVLRFQRSLETQSDRVVQGAALVIADNLIAGGRYGPGTPVDTGFLRSSWRASRNAPETVEGVAGTSESPTPEPDLTGGVIGARAGEVLYFTNGAEYAGIVEERQPFVAPVAANVPQIVADVARRLGEAP